MKQFGKHADAYNVARGKIVYPDSLYRNLAERAPAHEAALGTGCGNGVSTVRLQLWFRYVESSGLDEALIAKARENYPEIRFSVSPAETSVPQRRFDLVTSATSFYWMDRKQALAHTADWLTPGGLFCAYKYDFPIVYGPLRDLTEYELVNKWAKHRDPHLTRYDGTLEIMGSCPHLRDCRREVFVNITFLSPEEVALLFLSTSYVIHYIEQEGDEDYADHLIVAVREIESAPRVAMSFDIHAFTALNRQGADMSGFPILVSLNSILRHLGGADPRWSFLIDAREPERPPEYTWGDADRQVDTLAEQIAVHACRSVGVLLDNSYRNLYLIYAVIRAGKYLVLIDPEWGEAAKQAIVDEMRLDVLVSEHLLEGALVGLRLVLDFEHSATCRLDRAAYSHMTLFTSGTIGQPKGIELSQRAMLRVYCIGRDYLGINEHTRSGRFYRISSLGIPGINSLFPLLYGGNAVLLPLHCWADSEGSWEHVECFGTSFLYLAPSVVNHMVKEGSPSPRRLPLQRLLCVAGSARLDADLQAAFQRDYAALVNIYDLSECGFAFLFSKRRGDAFDNSMELTVGLEFKLTGPDGHPLEGSGERGHLWVCMPSLSSDYVNRPDLTTQVLEDGWLNTQNLVYFDEDRCAHALGRCNGTINKSGSLFYLNECERALNGLDEAIDVCCPEVDCPLYDEDYVAVIHTAPQVEFAFLPWLQQQLGVPRASQCTVLSHQVLPLNGVGKHGCRALVTLL